MQASTVPGRALRFNQWFKLAVLTLAALCGFALTLAQALESVEGIMFSRATLHWQVARGQIGHSQLRVDRTARSKTFTPMITYRYQDANGRMRQGWRIETTPGYNGAQAKRMVARFPAGAEVDVYHDGQGYAVLIPGARAHLWGWLAFWLVLSGLLGRLLVACWRAAARLWRSAAPAA